MHSKHCSQNFKLSSYQDLQATLAAYSRPILKTTSLLATLLTCALTWALQAQAPLTADDSQKAVADAVNPPTLVQTTKDTSLVSVLGYHEFTEDQEATEMRLPTDKFRKQMQALKDLKYTVISLEEFLAWKNGTLKLPERSVLITIDDGWKSVYTHAFPILKEFEYPFTLFLYKNYVDGGGKALSSDMIKEMMQHGASIGSHSVSHPYPSTVKKNIKLGTEAYSAFLNTEFGESKSFLEDKFDKSIETYAYPGGFHTPEMFDIAKQKGYACLFTVLPGKVSKTSENMTLPRYIILGTHDSIFENATRFPATANSTASLGAIVQSTPFPVTPTAGSTISNRMPTISVDFSSLDNIDPDSVVMRVSGFGKVPLSIQPNRKIFSWKVNRRLRKPTCDITVSWKLLDADTYEKPMRWTFIVDRNAAYIPTTAPSLPKAKTPDTEPTISSE
ncbi:polysaccharide deacetylase family protein [Rubritalea tangerina]|uniref:Polysaccharide deacetylase family protein n=1 Tax=Rubritalea tangerina TaxID=430798 RepID=A0ABW4Z9V6_9BACT